MRLSSDGVGDLAGPEPRAVASTSTLDRGSVVMTPIGRSPIASSLERTATRRPAIWPARQHPRTRSAVSPAARTSRATSADGVTSTSARTLGSSTGRSVWRAIEIVAAPIIAATARRQIGNSVPSALPSSGGDAGEASRRGAQRARAGHTSAPAENGTTRDEPEREHGPGSRSAPGCVRGRGRRSVVRSGCFPRSISLRELLDAWLRGPLRPAFFAQPRPALPSPSSAEVHLPSSPDRARARAGSRR